MSEEIIQKNASEAYVSDMVRYSIETNRRRAFPDYKDGLKLVQRRTLYAMAFLLPCSRELVKTAQVTGRVMGELHPHGDSSIDDVIKILSNWFDRYIPLIYSESNMGSMQGDGAAASRYTEVMLSQFTKEAIFSEMKENENIVDWTPTFTGKAKEPEYLPVKVPLLLINGCLGIGTGKSTNIPCHNINEVIDATLNLIDNPDAPVVLVPDQCMPCEIIDANWKQICNSGNGSFKVRAKIDIEIEDKGKANEHYMLVVKSTPDRVWIDDGKDTGVHYQINELIEKGRLPQITDLIENSHDKDMRYEIHLKKGSDPNYVRDYLYKATSLQVTQSVNFEVLNGIEPMERMSYKSYLQAFIEQRCITKYRYYCLKLQDARTQLHEKEICIMLIESGKVNELTKKIQKSKLKNDSELVNWLINLFNITDLQAKFILNYPMKKLAPVYLKQYKEEAKKLREIETICMNKILNDGELLKEIKEELIYFKNKYGFPRKSIILNESQISNIPQGTFRIVITENGFIKKLPVNEAVGSYRGDNPTITIIAENTSDLIMVTSTGRGYKIPVYKIPITEKNSIGIDIRILMKGITSTIIAIFDSFVLRKYADLRLKHYVVLCTEKNYIKKLDIEDLLVSTNSGIIMTKLNTGDQVKSCIIVPDNLDVVIYSKRKALRCPMSSIPNYKRNTVGNYAMNTKDDIDGIAMVDPRSTDILVITDAGYVNKFDITGLPVSERYKAGNNVIKLKPTDSIHSLFSTNDNQVITVLTKEKKYDIPVKDIQRASTASAGKKLIPLKGDIIIKVILN